MQPTDVQNKLIYWIETREYIRRRKEYGTPPPWVADPVFQTTYFCNVHREDDKVTKWIRAYYNSGYVDETMFEYNIILSRFVNKPSSLAQLGFQFEHNPTEIESVMSNPGMWGNAYVITTHGIKMPKAQYLAYNVLGAVYEQLEGLRPLLRGPSLARAGAALQGIEGIGPFLAGQVIADLKNTPGHPLESATDWASFALPGPGSLRGMSWFFYGCAGKSFSRADFAEGLATIRAFVQRQYDLTKTCNQDLQNVLCEYDKYMRVSTGSGRSKRNYPGKA